MTKIWQYLALGAAAVFLFIGLWLVGWQHTLRLERELSDAKASIEQMQIDHRDTLDAITKAHDAREAIHEQARLREEKLRKALENHELADCPVPDEWRMRLQWDKSDEVPATGEAASGCGDSGQGTDQDGR